MGLNGVFHVFSPTMIRNRRTQKLLLIFIVFLFLLSFAHFSTRIHVSYSFSQNGGISTSMGVPSLPKADGVLVGEVVETGDTNESSMVTGETTEGEHMDEAKDLFDENPFEEVEDHSQETKTETESSTVKIVSSTAQTAAENSPTSTTVEVIAESTSFPAIFNLTYEDAIVEWPEKKNPYTIILARTNEDISWIDRATDNDPMLTKAIYNVKDPAYPYKVPSNKGHEVMVYLTYIIDFYEVLPPVNIFMHAHETAWHNNAFMDASNAVTLKHLNHNKVLREGYMNLRCHIDTDCPGHLFPIARNSSRVYTPEEYVFGEAWSQILPIEPVPEVVSQPCCGQFAVSRERIHILPKSQYEFFREWLMQTTLADRISGRIWEYIYQYIWAGVAEFCPSAAVCYCDGFGLCFGNDEEYEVVRGKLGKLNKLRDLMIHGEQPSDGMGEKHDNLQGEIRELEDFIKDAKEKAWQRGENAELRAKDAHTEQPEKEGQKEEVIETEEEVEVIEKEEVQGRKVQNNWEEVDTLPK